MADDIDDLLNEVETKFCTKSPAKTLTGSKAANEAARPKSKTTKACRSAKSKEKDELDSMIDDIIDDPDPPEFVGHKSVAAPPTVTPARPSCTNGSGLFERKCFPVYLGGSGMAMGVGSTVVLKSCDQLRCTSCDFRIVFYDDYEWDQSCNYLFLRNNVPDFEKLRSKLKKRKGCRAYACQCCWRSIRCRTDLCEDHKLKWVCGKHTR